MIFVIGDIHGMKDKYEEMLHKMAPSDTDAVFVLGDIIDVGDDSIAILKDMMYRANIYPVLGEHEYLARKVLPLIAECKSTDEALEKLSGEEKDLLDKWLTMKSEKTISDFLSLCDEDKESIIDYLSEFQSYEEIKAGGKTFVLAHAGINGFDADKDLEDYSEEIVILVRVVLTYIVSVEKYLPFGYVVKSCK